MHPFPSIRSIALVVLGLGVALAALTPLAAGAESRGEASLDIRCGDSRRRDERRIEVVSEGANQVPCQTYYTKAGTRDLKADAQNAEGYCEEIAHRIRTNLETAGFECQDVADSDTAPPTIEPALSSTPPGRDEVASSPPPRVEATSTSLLDDETEAARRPQDDDANRSLVDHEVATVSRVPSPVSAAPPALETTPRLTPAALESRVNAVMAFKPDCVAEIDSAKYAEDRSFAVVRWSCQIGESGYASHLLVVFADETHPVSQRIGGSLTRDAAVESIDEEGRIQVSTRLYKRGDPDCCPSVESIDYYRVERSSGTGSIEHLPE